MADKWFHEVRYNFRFEGADDYALDRWVRQTLAELPYSLSAKSNVCDVRGEPTITIGFQRGIEPRDVAAVLGGLLRMRGAPRTLVVVPGGFAGLKSSKVDEG